MYVLYREFRREAEELRRVEEAAQALAAPKASEDEAAPEKPASSLARAASRLFFATVVREFYFLPHFFVCVGHNICASLAVATTARTAARRRRC